MLGYLLSGAPIDVFRRIAGRVPCDLADHPGFRLVLKSIESPSQRSTGSYIRFRLIVII